jgi:hypothetical protein
MAFARPWPDRLRVDLEMRPASALAAAYFDATKAMLFMRQGTRKPIA